MNVVLVSHPPDRGSGTGIYAARLGDALADRVAVDRVHVPVDARSPVPFLRAALAPVTEDASVVHVQFDYVVFGPRGAYALLFFPLLWLLARLRPVPVVVTVHEALTATHVAPPLARLKAAYLRTLNLTVAAATERLVFLSEQGRERFTDSVATDATTLVPHGVDTSLGDADGPSADDGRSERAATDGAQADDATADGGADGTAARRGFGFDPEDVVVVEPGYVDARKGTEVFVALAERRPEYEFLVAGGPARERHRPYLDRLRATAPDNVTITGTLPEERYHRAFEAADAAVLPYREVSQTGVVNPVTQSGVFNECAAHGLPVAATDCERFRALNEQWGCPLLFDVEDLDDVASCLDALLTDGSRRRLEAALSAYAAANALEHAVAEHVAVYEEVRD